MSQNYIKQYLLNCTIAIANITKVIIKYPNILLLSSTLSVIRGDVFGTL